MQETEEHQEPVIEPLLVDLKGLSKLLGGVSRSFLYLQMKRPGFPKQVTIGGRKMHRVSDVREWVERGCPFEDC